MKKELSAPDILLFEQIFNQRIIPFICFQSFSEWVALLSGDVIKKLTNQSKLYEKIDESCPFISQLKFTMIEKIRSWKYYVFSIIKDRKRLILKDELKTKGCNLLKVLTPRRWAVISGIRWVQICNKSNKTFLTCWNFYWLMI